MTRTTPTRATRPATPPAPDPAEAAPYFDPRLTAPARPGARHDPAPIDALEQMFGYYTA